jgi:hypothetical protein
MLKLTRRLFQALTQALSRIAVIDCPIADALTGRFILSRMAAVDHPTKILEPT